MKRLLVNHIGYEIGQPKQGILQVKQPFLGAQFTLVDNNNNEAVYRGELTACGDVDNWQLGLFYRLDFTSFEKAGLYHLALDIEDKTFCSEPFEIADALLTKRTLDSVMGYFKSQRSRGIWDETDKSLPFYGENRRDTVDVRGGWWDASGDKSKYLSHLSYANYMNPQHIPMAVWNMLEALNHSDKLPAELRDDLLDEALFGADFLCRMQDPAGYFYTTVFDTWSHDPEQRMICSYKTQQGVKNERWQAGWRQGGGVAIAALAKASIQERGGEFQRESYLAKAVKGYAHLKEFNCQYLDDGVENIIDDYCALLAALELFNATQDTEYGDDAKTRATSLLARLSEDSVYQGWFRADSTGHRPYFHAAEEGLPLLALLKFVQSKVAADELKVQVEAGLLQSVRFYQQVSFELNNPFNYVRQYQKPLGEDKRSAFFFPHNNETGYWWQGENARIASLTCTFRRLHSHFGEALPNSALQLAQGGLDWVLGLNPLDICMLHGKGRNNPPEYYPGHSSVSGGVCNGITSGFWDERGITFAPTDDPDHSWRWSEQWLPHGAWYLLAICS